MRQILKRAGCVVRTIGFLSLVGIQSLFLNLPKAYANAPYLASDVLGQNDFNSSNNGLSSIEFDTPTSTALDTTHHRLFVADAYNYRILVFNLDAGNSLIDKTADYVLGQPDFDTADYGTTAYNLYCDSYFCGLAYDPVKDYLYIADYYNYRILVFDVATITNGEDAVYVLGQPDFDTADYNSGIASMSYVLHVAIDSDRQLLFVSDEDNNRVQIFDVNTITNGEDAVYVLGQPDFDTTSCAVTQNKMCNNYGGLIYDTDNKRLFVGDTDGTNNRVLVFDVNTITNGEDAAYVLGQPDFSSTGANTTAWGFYYPEGMAYDSTNQLLYVAAYLPYRITVFDVSTITNGENAIAVLGETDFITNSGSGLSQSRLSFDYQSDFAYDGINKRLYFPDSYNSRIMIYSFINLPSSITSSGSTSSTYSSSLTASQSQGTVSYTVSAGSLPPGLSLNTSSGLLSGTPTTAGTYSFTITAIDDNGTVGYFKDSKSYVLGISAASTPSSSTTTTKKTSYSTTDEDITPEEVAITDTPLTDKDSSPIPTKTPIPSQLLDPNPSNFNLEWSAGGISLLFILAVLGALMVKKSGV